VDALNYGHSAVDNGQSVRTVFIDYFKAFDHVNHNILVAKLREHGLPDVIIQWLCAFSTDRRQRVKIGSVFCKRLLVHAGMAQGSYLGPLTFIIVIDSLKSAYLTHKFVDVITLTEILDRGVTSRMQQSLNELLEWSRQHAMIVNGQKSKEIIIGPIIKPPPPQLSLDVTAIDRVKTFKLLEVYVSDNLKWQDHRETICFNAASRLHFLKLLARSGASSEDLVCFYTSIVRPIMEHACPLWHSSLTVPQSEALEAIQKQRMRHVCRQFTTILVGIDNLHSRRKQLTMTFFLSSRYQH
jgi:Reverse transcriptase (RNA-dependent DNA polymerase)